MSLSVTLRHRLGTLDLDVAFEAPGGVTALFGRSGAGKTSVVNAVAGLLQPDSGSIVLNGKSLLSQGGTSVPKHRRRIGYVFQDARLFPHLSVRGNLLYGARNDHGLQRVTDLLGIGDLLRRRPRALSGGEAQRVAIGRALLSEPELLIMDEPLAALDAARKAEILPYLERLRDEAGLPILFVSHSVEEVARLATTLVLMDRGRVVRTGPAADLLADPTLAPIFGPRMAGAVLPGRIAAQHDDGLTEIAVSGGRLFLPATAGAPGDPLRVRIAAQDVMLALDRPENVSALNILSATVTEVQPGQGPGVMVQLRAGDDLLLARITRRSADALGLRPGTPCFAVLKSVAVAQGAVGRG
ncbi:molybdenum ABC transporter ATP-binding protein [Pseudooceanicola onchidii]|uniref:molybdenum ABC transporter ATP-binding protein n=1 Tax=Pseudooceanicola onchidii TaxID=2562279 RepID=UPI0010A9A5C5|nr:molybdenum ABC transporter ATP-binding protein [Pseudooceanicola onchidii]